MSSPYPIPATWLFAQFGRVCAEAHDAPPDSEERDFCWAVAQELIRLVFERNEEKWHNR